MSFNLSRLFGQRRARNELQTAEEQRKDAALTFERLEDRIMLTVLNVGASSYGEWTFRDADDDLIRLTISTGPNSAASIDVYNQNGANKLFDAVPGGPLGAGWVFNAVNNLPVDDSPSSVAISDFDNDNHLDFVVANAGSDNFSIRLGVGDGTFGSPAVPEVAVGAGVGSPSCIAVGDFNNDGNDDVVLGVLDTTAAGNDFVTVLLGNGAGAFAAPNNFAIVSQPTCIAVGDFNGDSNADLAVTNGGVDINGDYVVSALLGDGTGAFGAATSTIVGNIPSYVVTGDFTESGDLDLAVANWQDNTVSILQGNGGGAFAIDASPVTVGSRPTGLAIGQLNNDNPGTEVGQDSVIDALDHLDIVVANSLSDNITVMRGVGDGTFTSTNYDVSSGGRPSGVAIGNFDIGGVPDIAVINRMQDSVTALLGNGVVDTAPGTFALAPIPNYPTVGDEPVWLASTYGMLSSTSTALDFNEDALDDLVIANRDDTTVPGTFTASVLLASSDALPRLDIGYIEIITSDIDTRIFINEYSHVDSDTNGDSIPDTRMLMVEPFTGDNTPGAGTEPNFADLPHFARRSDFLTRPWIGAPGGAVWVRGDIFTQKVNQDVGLVWVGGTFGLDDDHTGDAAGQPGAADGTTGDNGAIRISGHCGQVAVGFLAGSVNVGGNLGSLTTETDAGFIIRTSDETTVYDDEGPTFRNSSIDIGTINPAGGTLGLVESNRGGEGDGHWRTPINVAGLAFNEAAVYTDAAAGSGIPTASLVHVLGEGFFQITGSHSTGDGADYYRVDLLEGQNMHLFVPRGEMVRILDSFGTQFTISDIYGNAVMPIASEGYVSTRYSGNFTFTIDTDYYDTTEPHGNFVAPADGTYYIAVSWTEADTNLDGLHDTTLASGPVNPESYDIFVGITDRIIYEREVIQSFDFNVTQVASQPNTRGYFVTEEATNDTWEDAEFVTIANGAVTIHGVIGRAEDTDNDTSTVELDDFVDYYRIVVEAGTRIFAGINHDIQDQLYNPTPLESGPNYYSPAIGLLDAEGNVLSSSWAWDLGTTASTTGWAYSNEHYIDYMAPEAGIYYIAATYDGFFDNEFTGESRYLPGYTDYHYEIFVAGTSTKQTFGGMDTGEAGTLGVGTDAVTGEISHLVGDIALLQIGGEVLTDQIDVWAGDIVYLETTTLGNADEISGVIAFLARPIITVSDNIHRVEAGVFERGYFDVGQDVYFFHVAGDWSGPTSPGLYDASLFVRDDIGVLGIDGTFWGNTISSIPNVVVDYDQVNAPGDFGTIDWISAGTWGTSSHPVTVITMPGGNVRFVEVAGSVFQWEPIGDWTLTVPTTSISASSGDGRIVNDDSGSQLAIGLDEGTSGSYQRVPIYGCNSTMTAASAWLGEDIFGGVLDIRFIGHAIDDLALTGGAVGDDGSVPGVTLSSQGQIDIGTLALSGDMALTAVALNGGIYFREITGGTELSSITLAGRADIVGITGDDFRFIRISNGNLGWTPAHTNDGNFIDNNGGNFTGYRPGTFVGPVLMSAFTPLGDSPDLVVSGLQLTGSIGELTVWRTVIDVEVGGSVGGEEFMSEPIELPSGATVPGGASGLSHKIRVNSDGIVSGPYLNGKAFEGLAGAIYVAEDVGNTLATDINTEGLGGIDLMGSLLHSGSGNHPLTGIFCPGTVTQIYASGPTVVLSGDIFVTFLGISGADGGMGGLILANDARIYDLYLTGHDNLEAAYDARLAITTGGQMTNFVMQGDQTRVVGLFLGYSLADNILMSGLGIHHSYVWSAVFGAFTGTGSEFIMNSLRFDWLTDLVAIRAGGYGINNCVFTSSFSLGMLQTTDRVRGDFTDTTVSIVGDMTSINIAHDIVRSSFGVGGNVRLVIAGNDILGLAMDASEIRTVEAGNDALGLDISTAGYIQIVQATRGRMAGPRIRAFGPWGRIGTILANGNISVVDISSWGTIRMIRSTTGTITGTVTTNGPNATIGYISVATGLAANLTLAGNLNALIVMGGNLTGVLTIAGNIGVVHVVAGSILGNITSTGGNIGVLYARNNIGGAGHTITSAGNITMVYAMSGFVNSTITANGTSTFAMGVVMAGTTVLGAINSGGGVNLVMARAGNMAANITAALGINVVYAFSGSVNGNVGAQTNVAVVMAIGGNIAGSVTSATGNVTVVMALNGNVTGNVGAGASVGSVMAINGNITGSNITAVLNITNVMTTGANDITNTNIRAGGRLMMVMSGRDLVNVQARGSNVTIVRAMRDTNTVLVAAGYDFGADFAVNTGDDTLASGSVLMVFAGRNIIDTNVVAGVGPGGDPTFGDGTDAGAGGGGTIVMIMAGGTFQTVGPSYGFESDSGTFMVRDSTGSLNANAGPQAFPGTAYNVQVL